MRAPKKMTEMMELAFKKVQECEIKIDALNFALKDIDAGYYSGGAKDDYSKAYGKLHYQLSEAYRFLFICSNFDNNVNKKFKFHLYEKFFNEKKNHHFDPFKVCGFWKDSGEEDEFIKEIKEKLIAENTIKALS